MSATATAPLQTTAAIESCSRVGAYSVLTIGAPDIASSVAPGQFLEIATDVALLRRPFSVYRTDVSAGTLSIAFDAIGAATGWMASCEPGQPVDVVGPLGHGFSIPDEPGTDLIVGGGYGTAALVFLAEQLADRGGDVHAVLGGRSAERVFDDGVLDGICASTGITTDDGSRGKHGIVTDPLPALIERFSPRTIYACGPMVMLGAVARVGMETGVRTELAVEEFMACGIGVCWTCVLPVRVDGELRHLRSCTEGPVFAGEDVVWP
jgi:dihydroorotate dehydrogenase electron transfer subunit